MKSPPLNALYAFEAFARRGGMTAAADELCVTHGAVSRQVRQLEDRLGVVLVEGPKTRLRLTEAGLALADQLTTAFRSIETAVGAQDRGASSLHLSCLGSLAMKWLIPRLASFHAANPDVQVRIAESYAPVDFRRGGFDLAVRVGQGFDTQAMEVTPFMRQFHGPVLAPRLLSGSPDARAVLSDLPRLWSQSYPQAWLEWQKNAGVALAEPATTRAFEHNTYMIEAAAAGLGAAVCPWTFVAEDLAQGRLVAPFGFAATGASYVVLRPKGARHKAAALFRDWLVAQGARMPEPAEIGAPPQANGGFGVFGKDGNR